MAYENEYKCPGCSCVWFDYSEGTQDDECPDCGTSSSPISSVDANPDLEPEGVIVTGDEYVPGSEPAPYTIHKDQVITLEAAKLLGLPFTWGNCRTAVKFVTTASGVELRERVLGDFNSWADTPEVYCGTLTDDDLINDDTGEMYDLYVVTFSDDGEADAEG